MLQQQRSQSGEPGRLPQGTRRGRGAGRSRRSRRSRGSRGSRRNRGTPGSRGTRRNRRTPRNRRTATWRRLFTRELEDRRASLGHPVELEGNGRIEGSSLSIARSQRPPTTHRLPRGRQMLASHRHLARTASQRYLGSSRGRLGVALRGALAIAPLQSNFREHGRSG